MKRLLVAFAAFFWASAPLAASRSWDILTFDPPPGEEESHSTRIGFTQVDRTSRTWCRVMLSNSQPSMGEPLADFYSISGVWMAHKASYPLSTQVRPHWVVLFDDGEFLTNMPNGGLRGLDREAVKRAWSSSWGTYTWDGRQGLMTKPGVKLATHLAKGKPGQLLVDDVPHFRLAPVDGLRLEGAWTTYADPSDPSLDARPVGQRPVIRLSSSGRFVDEGIFATTTLGIGLANTRGGEGTYTIEQFSIVLRYADGRVLQQAFNGFLGMDPRTDDGRVYIDRTELRKRP